MENKDECLQMAEMANASHLVVIGIDGKVADEIELVPNNNYQLEQNKGVVTDEQ
jgi:hypothetical protein